MQESAGVPTVAEAEPEPEAAPEVEINIDPEPAEPVESAPAVAAVPAEDETVTWKHVAPIFATCRAKCHTDQGLMGPAPEGYRLTSYEPTKSGGHVMKRSRKPGTSRKPPEPTESHAEIEDWNRRVTPDLNPMVEHLDRQFCKLLPGLRYAIKWRKVNYGLPIPLRQIEDPRAGWN